MQRKALPEILGGFFIFYLDMSKGLGYIKGKGNVAQTKEPPMKKIRKNLRKAFTLVELLIVLFFIFVVIPLIGGVGYVIFHFLAKVW